MAAVSNSASTRYFPLPVFHLLMFHQFREQLMGLYKILGQYRCNIAILSELKIWIKNNSIRPWISVQCLSCFSITAAAIFLIVLSSLTNWLIVSNWLYAGWTATTPLQEASSILHSRYSRAPPTKISLSPSCILMVWPSAS